MTTFILSLGFSLLLIPLVRRLCIRLGLVVQPRQDRWHRKPTPRLGGVGIFLAFAFGLLINSAMNGEWEPLPGGILAGSGLAFLVGFWDDLRPMSPVSKLLGQILAATVVIALGYTSTFFSPRIANAVIAQIPNILLTYLWIVGITNALNLLDNMDGLAGGIALITAGILAYFFWRSGNQGLLWVSLALAGGVLGFLFYNFPPASIFMGDSGSLFLGFTLAVLAIAQQQQASNVFAVVAVPTLLFLLPILDTLLVTFTRLMRGQSPVQGGRDHTSHRLIAFGLSERQTLLALFGVALASGILAAALESLNYWLSLALAPFLILSLALLTAYLGRLKMMESTAPPGEMTAFARIMSQLTYRGRLLEVILDFFLIATVYYMAFLTSFGLVMDQARLALYLQTLPLALAGAYISFYAVGVYRGVWRYVGMNDLARYFQAAVGSAALLAGAVFLVVSMHLIILADEYSPRIVLVFAVYLFLGLAASRSSFRLLDLFFGRQAQTDVERILIYGAGDAGEMALRWVLMNPELKYQPVGFLDDDPLMRGRQIHGVEVLAGLEGLEAILARGGVEGLVLADASLEEPGDTELLATCRGHGCWVRRLCLGFEIVEV